VIMVNIQKIAIIIFLVPSFLIGAKKEKQEIALKRYMVDCRKNANVRGKQVIIKRYHGDTSDFQAVERQGEYFFEPRYLGALVSVRKGHKYLTDLDVSKNDLKKTFFLFHHQQVYGFVSWWKKLITLDVFDGFKKSESRNQCCPSDCMHTVFMFENKPFIQKLKNISSNGRELLFECEDEKRYIMPESELEKLVKIPTGKGRSVKSAARRK